MHFLVFGIFVYCLLILIPAWILISVLSRRVKERRIKAAEKQLNEKQNKLTAILRIGHETSCRGKGMSLRQALHQTDYRNIRKQFSPQDLIPLIQSHRAFINDWIMYSEDKRTSGGYYITETGVIGQIDKPDTVSFSRIEDAIAEYIVKELDYWENLGK